MERWLLLLAVFRPLEAVDSCDCSCCVTTERLPAEVENNFNLKCARPAADKDTCNGVEQCVTGATDQVLTAAGGAALDYSRFCFFECKVPSGLTSALGSECVELSAAELAAVASDSGNALDLADLHEGDGALGGTSSDGAAGVSSSESGRSASAGSSSAGSPTPAPGTALALAGKAAAEAARTEARATAAEAKAAAAAVATVRTAREANQAAAAGNGAVAHLRGQVVQAKLHARAAAAAAAETRNVLEEVKAAAHDAAVEVGKQAAAEVQGEADQAKRILASMIASASVPPPPEIPESVGKVMGPYFAAAGRAMTTMGLYSDQAQQMTNNAGVMREQARTMANQANDYQAAGDTANAAKMLGTAHDLMGKADSLQSGATTYQNVAASINSGLPLYENARAAAGARAAYWANLPGMIPPPVPPR